MAEAKSRLAWDQTACLLAMYVNIHRSSNKSPVHPSDFHPHRKRKKKPLPKVGIRALKHIFIDRRPNEELLATLTNQKGGSPTSPTS